MRAPALETLMVVGPNSKPVGQRMRFDADNVFGPGLHVTSKRPPSGGPTSGWWGTTHDQSTWENWTGRPGTGVLGIGRGSEYSGA